MNNLEDLWESYPSPEPPTADLLREARRRARARRRRLIVRPLLAAATAAVVAGGFVAGAHTGGKGGTATSAAGPALRNSAFQADLHPATSCNQLLASYRSRALAQVSAYGWTMGAATDQRAPLTSVHGGFAGPAMDSFADSAQAPVGSSGTGTNVQETGVDEPDQVKTDGSLIVRIHGSTLSVYDASGVTIRRTARLALPRLAAGQILLAGHTVVAIGADTAPRSSRRSNSPGSRIETVSLTDPARPAIVSDVAYSGRVSSTRQHGSVVRTVIDAGLPDLGFVYPHGKVTEKQALAHNRRAVRTSTLTDWLPTYDDGSGARPLLSCDRVAIPPAGLALGTVAIVGFDATAPAAFDAIGVAGQTDIAYESASHLYLTSGGAGGGCACPLVAHVGSMGADAFSGPCCGSSSARTTIFQFDLAGIRAVHVATGKVSGSIADRWSMDEAGGVLRVAVSHPSSRKPSSSVITLHADGTRLVVDGRLDGLGVNESLTAARWFDDLAILSTARQTDPLFSVDLSDPAHPRLLGALHIPGYTTYFHPIGEGLLIGVGQKVAFDRSGEQERAQVALFDISDLADAHRLDVEPLHRWTWPEAGDDPRSFTWLPDRATALTAFQANRGSTVLGIYHLSGRTLTARLRTVPMSDAANVRTFELSDGRVVLVAGGRLQFLSLAAG